MALPRKINVDCENKSGCCQVNDNAVSSSNITRNKKCPLFGASIDFYQT